MSLPATTSRPSLPALAVLAALALALGAAVIRDFSSPLVGPGDVNQWEHIGFYVSENFRWTPLPHLELRTDQLFYPYGVSAVFQSWGLERDLLFSFLFRAFGRGPWLRWYYLASLLIGFAGVYLLLYREVGHVRATAASVLANLFNFYAINKFPFHLNIAAVHWMSLGFVADYLVFRRLAAGRWPSLRLVLLRSCLTVLVLGSDLAYVAAFSLLSLTVTAGVAAGLWISRTVRPSYAEELRRRPGPCLALVAATAFFAWLYVPPIVGIVGETARFADETELVEADRRVILAASPLRLLLPYLPWLHPGTPRHLGFGTPWLVFADNPEGLGAGSVGWTLLALALGGLWGMRRRWLPALPLVLLFALLALYGPHLPTLKLLPWTAFTRVASRTTVALPVVCALLSLGVRWPSRRRARRLAVTAVAVLGLVEVGVAYDLGQWRRPAQLPDPRFWALMEQVRAQPGEAVLDWPFCVVGGNGVGRDELCPFYERNHTVSTYRRFHRKKVVGHYFGRLRRAQIEPFVAAGWPRLLAAAAAGRCFSPAEWDVFTEFYAGHDFAALLLYPDLLPEPCVEEFYRRFGRPTASAELISAGRVELVPKRRIDGLSVVMGRVVVSTR